MDIKRLDLNLLVALDALLDEQNVTRAANRLSMSQPALSNALQRLRTMFGDPLFTRGQRGLIPTERALSLAPPIKQLLREAEDIVRPPVFDPATTAYQLRVATTDYMLVTLIVPLVEQLRKLAPQISVTVRSLEFPDIPARLANGDLDLAITIPEFTAQHLQSRRLYTDGYVGATRRGHPIGTGTPTIEELCRYPHTLVAPAGGPICGPVDDALALIGSKRAISVSVPNFLAVPYLLAVSDLVAICPERLFHKLEGDLTMFEVPLAVPTFDVIAVWHPRSQNDQAHRWVQQMLVAIAAGSSNTDDKNLRMASAFIEPVEIP